MVRVFGKVSRMDENIEILFNSVRLLFEIIKG